MEPRIWYCDGSTWKNGQPGQDSSFLVVSPFGDVERRHLGDCSINAAELRAIAFAAGEAWEGDEIRTDSELCWRWITGPFKETASNRYLAAEVRSVKRDVALKGLLLAWVRRENNAAGAMIESDPFYADARPWKRPITS